MIKRLKPVIILGAVLLVLIAAFFVIRHFLPKAENTEETNTVYLLDEKLNESKIPAVKHREGVQLDEADSIKIENAFGSYTLVKKAIGTYYMQGKKNLAVLSESVVTLLNNIGTLGVNQTVLKKPTEKQLKNYGLDRPDATVTVVNDDDTYVLKIGISTSDTNNYYAQISGDPAVYLIGNTVPDVVMLSRNQFYSDTMIEYSEETKDLETLKKMVIGGAEREQEIIIEMNKVEDDEVGAAYMMTAPFSHPFSSTMQENLTGLLSALVTCPIASDDTSAAGLRKYGLDQPAYSLTFVMNGKSQTVYFGDVSEADYRYCYAKGGDFIHNVAETDADVLYAPLKDYCEDMIYTNAYDTMESIKISGNGKTYQIAIGESNEEGDFAVSINNKVVDSELFSDFYAHMLMIGISDLGGKEGAKTSYLTIELKQRGGATDVIKFYEVGNNKCYCEVNGSGNFWVKTYSVDKILTNAQNLYDGESINLEF